jgi:hypothetical protein
MSLDTSEAEIFKLLVSLVSNNVALFGTSF